MTTDANESTPLRDRDPDSYTTLTVCLPCAHGECFACYGEGCECLCAGEYCDSPPPGQEIKTADPRHYTHAPPFACAECGTTTAQTYVVTILDYDNPHETRTEVCRACDDAIR